MQKRILLIMVFMAATINYSQNPCPNIPTVTYAGKTYNTVQIGTQCWFKENLDAGIQIIASLNQTNDSIIEKFCYDNDPNNCNIYGGLYQWDEAMAYSTTLGTKGICPDGWHIPTMDEFQTLKTAVGNDGNALKAVGQGSGAGTGTNTSGFSALLAGFRGWSDGNSYELGYKAFFHSSKNDGSTNAFNMGLNNSSSNIYSWDYWKWNSFGLRCLKDAGTTGVEQEEGLPTAFQLMQNYPNPFNPTTTISYQIPVAGHVSLKVYDLLGRAISTLVNVEIEAGYHEVNFDASNEPSGVYFYKLQVYPANSGAGNFTDSKRMMLIK